LPRSPTPPTKKKKKKQRSKQPNARKFDIAVAVSKALPLLGPEMPRPSFWGRNTIPEKLPRQVFRWKQKRCFRKSAGHNQIDNFQRPRQKIYRISNVIVPPRRKPAPPGPPIYDVAAWAWLPFPFSFSSQGAKMATYLNPRPELDDVGIGSRDYFCALTGSKTVLHIIPPDPSNGRANSQSKVVTSAFPTQSNFFPLG